MLTKKHKNLPAFLGIKIDIIKSMFSQGKFELFCRKE